MSTVPPGGSAPPGGRPDGPQHNGSPAGKAQGKAAQGQRPPVSNVSDKEVEQFAAAVSQLRQQQTEAQGGQKEKGSAPDPEVMRQTIQDAGLSVNRYNRISEALRQDPDLQTRVQDKLSQD